MGDLSELGDYDIEDASSQAEDFFGGGAPMDPDAAYLYDLEQHGSLKLYHDLSYAVHPCVR